MLSKAAALNNGVLLSINRESYYEDKRWRPRNFRGAAYFRNENPEPRD